MQEMFPISKVFRLLRHIIFDVVEGQAKRSLTQKEEQVLLIGVLLGHMRVKELLNVEVPLLKLCVVCNQLVLSFLLVLENFSYFIESLITLEKHVDVQNLLVCKLVVENWVILQIRVILRNEQLILLVVGPQHFGRIESVEWL
jgi:hypothetical protein